MPEAGYTSCPSTPFDPFWMSLNAPFCFDGYVLGKLYYTPIRKMWTDLSLETLSECPGLHQRFFFNLSFIRFFLCIVSRLHMSTSNIDSSSNAHLLHDTLNSPSRLAVYSTQAFSNSSHTNSLRCRPLFHFHSLHEPTGLSLLIHCVLSEFLPNKLAFSKPISTHLRSTKTSCLLLCF